MKKQILLITSLLIYCCHLFGQKATILSGYLVNFSKDSIKCILLSSDKLSEPQMVKFPIVNGVFKQRLKIKTPTYVFLTNGENYINGLIDPGDSHF